MNHPLQVCALSPPRAHGPALGTATLKSVAEDFVVDEVLGFEPDGGVGHRLLHVEKRGVDTLHAARLLARHAGVAPRDVGFAGLKDRHAVARQWFTVPAGRTPVDWSTLPDERLRVCRDDGHSRKLRRGALRGNRFHLRLRDVHVDAAIVAERVALLRQHGVPNYFGPQRFGRDGDNIAAVLHWVDGGALPNAREARAFVYSAARSMLFNAVLATRVNEGTWAQLLPGERVNLAGRNSWFVADAIDETLLERLALFDIHPTGPMPGRGEGPGGVAGDWEAAVLAPHHAIIDALTVAGVEAARRATRVVPEGFEAHWEDDVLSLVFALPAGCYATMVVRELFETSSFSEGGEDAQG
jgi:tRNA pseudouridine13 synthase